MISLGLKLYEQAKDISKIEDDEVFSSLIKSTFECAQETISNAKNISINNIKSKQIQENLYNIFDKTKEGTNNQYWNNYYLSKHPLRREFKKTFQRTIGGERTSRPRSELYV
jgi:bisphosphoglycerate-dependent phosphoglycerate mutase